MGSKYGQCLESDLVAGIRHKSTYLGGPSRGIAVAHGGQQAGYLAQHLEEKGAIHAGKIIWGGTAKSCRQLNNNDECFVI